MSTYVSLAHRAHRRRLLLSSAAAAIAVGFLSYQYYRFLLRRRALQRRAVQLHSASELSTQLLPCYYGLLQQYCGGLMDNCAVHSVRRVRGEVVAFCAGGWSAVPPSRYPIPSYEWEERRNEAADARKERLDLFWLGRCVGKGLVFNASFAFYLALLVRRQQSPNHSSSTPLLTHLSHPVVSLSLHVGRFSSQSPPSLSVSCEIGRIDHDALEAYRASHWGMDPDWEGSGLAECLSFGCGEIEAYAERENAMPAQENAEVDQVVWKRVRYPWTAAGQDVWISVTTREGTFHFDLTAPVHSPPAAYHTVASSADSFSPVLLPALQRHRPDLLVYAPPHPSCFKPAVFAPAPDIAVLSEAEWRKGGGRSEKRVIGADAVIEWVQSEVLLNEREMSAEYVQVERVVREACQMAHLSTWQLYNARQKAVHSRHRT